MTRNQILKGSQRNFLILLSWLWYSYTIWVWLNSNARWGDSHVCVSMYECGVDPVNMYNCYSGAYNNAGLVSKGGVITSNVPPPPYNATHKVAGMIRGGVCLYVRACVCGWVGVRANRHALKLVA